MARNWDSLPMEIQTMILTKAVEHPYRNYEDPDWNVDVRFGVKCFRVCKSWDAILRRLLPTLAAPRFFLQFELETFALEAIQHRILRREKMVSKAGNRRNMSRYEADAFEKVITHLAESMMLASLCGFITCMRLVLENVPELPEIGRQRNYLIHDLAASDKPEVLKLLLDQDWILETMEERDCYGNTLLGHAAHVGNYTNMEILMDYGASTDIRPSRIVDDYRSYYYQERGNGRFLTFATTKNDTKMLKLLLERGLKPEWEENPNEDNHLCIALEDNNLEIVQILLDHGANLNFDVLHLKLPLSSAIESCSLKMIEKLIDLGADIHAADYDSFDALSTAIQFDRQDAFTFLLGRGAILKPNHLHHTVGRSLSIAAQILDMMGIETAGAASALVSACRHGQEDFVQLFLDCGVDPIFKDGNRSISALEVACSRAKINVVEMLLKAGADVNAAADAGETSLDLECHSPEEELVNILFDPVPGINADLGPYERALLAAVDTGDSSVVGLLLEHGAEVNFVGRTRGTALSLANKRFPNNTNLSGLLVSWGGLTTEDLEP